MPTVIFVAPYFMEATLRFVGAVARLDGVRMGLVSVDPAERIPPELRAHVAAHWRVDDALDPDQVAAAVMALSQRIGPPSKLVGTLEELQVPLALAREKLGLAGLSSEAARNFRDKARMKTVLASYGLPCARHRLCATADEARAFAREVSFPLVFKPQAGAGARNTFRVDDEAQLEQALSAMPPTPSKPVLAEEFVTGEEHSFDAVLVRGKPVWHSIGRYFPSPLEVLRHPWIQWCVVLPRSIDGPEYEAIRHAGFDALRTLGLETGLAHMEWFRRADGSIAISEVGARPPGAQFTTLLSYAHDVDMYAAWGRLAALDQFEPPRRRWAVGIAYLRGQGPGRVRQILGLDEVARDVGPLVVEARLPREGQQPSGTYEGEGYVILRHEDTATVERGLARLVTGLRVEMSPA
jgi:formate-dependent phosphoribosylglycinamide formyltransferase (GAR transformylase)